MMLTGSFRGEATGHGHRRQGMRGQDAEIELPVFLEELDIGADAPDREYREHDEDCLSHGASFPALTAM